MSRQAKHAKIRVYLVCLAISTFLFYYLQSLDRAGQKEKTEGKDLRQERMGQRAPRDSVRVVSLEVVH